MSRIGNQPVVIPSGVELKFADGTMGVTGPKGSLRQRLPAEIAVEIDDKEVRFARSSDKPKFRALHGLAPWLNATTTIYTCIFSLLYASTIYL